MIDHSVEGYMRRLSSEDLEAFLQQRMLLGQWYDYDHIVPQIIEILQQRSYSVPKPIMDSWQAYLEKQNSFPT